MTGVGGLCWYEEGDLDPKLDQVVNLPGLSKLRSKRPHDKGEDPEVSAKQKNSYDPHKIISLLSHPTRDAQRKLKKKMHFFNYIAFVYSRKQLFEVLLSLGNLGKGPLKALVNNECLSPMQKCKSGSIITLGVPAGSKLAPVDETILAIKLLMTP